VAALTSASSGDVAPKDRPPVAGRKPAPLAIGALMRHLGWPMRTGRHRGPGQREPQSRVPVARRARSSCLESYARSARITSSVAWPGRT